MLMKNIRVFNSTATGESHKATNKVCQDSSASFEDSENGLFICAVSDGHGGDMYFRSDRGSKLLTKITIDTIRQFIENIDGNLFAVPFTAISARTTEVKEKIDRKVTSQDEAVRRLFSSILSQWNDGITKDWSEDPPTTEEMQTAKVPESAIKSFLEGKGTEFAYGCTLIAFARTPVYWFAIQLGDGKCIAFNSNAIWSEPIPWDEQCSGSKTTSTCEINPLDNLRYCYGNTDFPVALFIGSDGLDGAYGNMDDLALFYSAILKSFAKDGFKKTIKEIDESLPKLSAIGISRDDMSLAGVIDMDEIPMLYPLLMKKDIENAKNELAITEEVLNKKKEDVLEKESAIKQKQEEVISFRNIIIEQEEIITSSKSKLVKANEDFEKKEIEVKRAEEDLIHVQSGLEKSVKEKEILQRKITDLTNEFKEIYKEELSNTDSAVEIDDTPEKTPIDFESEEGDSSVAKKSIWQKLGLS
jgi:hypothetical protein